MFARFDENPAMTEDIKETKHYGRMDMKTAYPPETKSAGV